jgi:aldose 1-epimerase
METMAKRPFGTTAAGEAADLYTLAAGGLEVSISNYGGTVTSIKAPDAAGNLADVVLGFDSVAGYQKAGFYPGATIGRYANRIGNCRFALNGVEYKLYKNNGENSLHGGLKGFDKVVWNAREIPGEEPALELTYFSKDGEEGYPGNLSVTVKFTVTKAAELRVEYTATTDKDTVVNMTNHSYFNLAGEGSADIQSHVMQLNASRFTPVDAGLIPTGELRPVEGTAFDFRKPLPIGSRIGQEDEQLKRGCGYDHNFVIDGADGTLRTAAVAYDPKSGRTLEVLTTEPGVQLYTGNYLDGTSVGKCGKGYEYRTGFCLETQKYPDTPNHADFPTAKVPAGGTYKSTSVYRFGAK